jgi:hypothetical protein
VVGSPAGQDPSASEPVRITEIRTPGPVHESAAQIKGVLPLPLSALRSTLPVFKNPANRHRGMSLTAEQFRYAFGNAVFEQESQELYQRWAIPAPGKPLFEAAAAKIAVMRFHSSS